MTREIDLRLNPELDPAPYADAYARDKLVRIPDVLEPECANAVADLLERSIEWRLVFPEPSPNPGERETVARLTRSDIAAMGREEMGRRMQGVMERARDNYGYLYNAYPMIEAYTGGWDEGHPIHTLTEFLNSEDFLEFGRQVIGVDKVTKADAQATLYTRGNFLTRHVDEGHDKERRAAYTFGFTRQWQPDWGGMLMLLNDDLDASRALLPRFNVLSIFDGCMLHAVSPVSPFAGAGRYQITGWFRDDPPYRG
jgi:Rps23 Pro-64 3,4-dihydroxylase Tpa1-like proline 4-hydroxylase